MRVVVVGGGITGSLLSYFLAHHQVSIVLVERSGIGNQASGQNPGGINPLHGPGIPGPMFDLAIRSHQLHRDISAEIAGLSGMDCQIQDISRIEVALDDSDTTRLEAAFTLYNDTQGFAARRLDRGELLAIEPRIGPEVSEALLLQGNGIVDAHAYSVAAAEAARALGASLRDDNVTGLKRDSRRVTGVQLEHGQLDCDALVLATGPWLAKAGDWLDMVIPVTPVKGQLLLVDLPGPALHHHLTRAAMGIYMLPDAQLMLGGTWEQAGFDTEPTQHGLNAIMDGVARIMPCVRDARPVRQMAALRPATPDGLPIIGRAPGWDNVFLASGGGAKGMLLSAGMAESVAAMIAGNAPALNLTPFRPDRFGWRSRLT